MALSSKIIAKLGLDTAEFSAGLNRVNNSITQFAGQTSAGIRGVTRVVGDLRRLFLAGGLFTAAKSFFDSAIEYSRNYKGAMDENVNATLRFSESLDKWQQAKARFGSAVIGAIEKGTIGLASLIYGVEAGTAAWDEMNAATQRALDDKRVKDYAAALQGLAKINRDIAFQEADAWQKVTMLINEQADLKQRIRDVGAETVEGAQLLGQLAKSEAESRKIIDGLMKEEAKAVAEKAAAEKAAVAELEKQKLAAADLVKTANLAQQAAYDSYLVEQKKTAELQKQLDLLMEQERLTAQAGLVSESTLYAGGRAFGASRNQRDIEQASSDALQELIRRARSDISFVEQTKGRGPTASADIASGFIIQGSIIARLQTDIQRAQFQLDQRNKAGADFAFGGEAAARRNFQGDPLEFDRFYQQNGKALDENTATLRDIKNRLSQPLQVLSINQPSPFPR